MSGFFRLLRRVRAATRGSVAIEFAFVVLPFLLIVFGLLQVGLTFGAMAALNEAATETARALENSDEFNGLASEEAQTEYAQIQARSRFKGPDPARVVAVLEDSASGSLLRLSYDMPLLVPIRDWTVTRLDAAALVGE